MAAVKEKMEICFVCKKYPELMFMVKPGSETIVNGRKVTEKAAFAGFIGGVLRTSNPDLIDKVRASEYSRFIREVSGDFKEVVKKAVQLKQGAGDTGAHESRPQVDAPDRGENRPVSAATIPAALASLPLTDEEKEEAAIKAAEAEDRGE